MVCAITWEMQESWQEFDEPDFSSWEEVTFFLCSMGRLVLVLFEWQVAHPGLSSRQVGCLERAGKHKEHGEGLCVYFLVCLVGLKPELFFDILYLLCIMALDTLPWRHAPDLNPSLSRANKGGSLLNFKRQNCTVNSSKYMPGDFVCCESFQLSLRSVCVLGCPWSGTPAPFLWRQYFR